MKQVVKSKAFVVYDDVLPQSEFEKLWLYIQREEYSSPMTSGNWLKVWRQGDCFPLGTRNYDYSTRPFNNALDALLPIFIKLAEMNPEIVQPWKDLGLRTYLYPRGSKLSWHDDNTSLYSAALTMYCHPKWGSTWGGDLMVAEVPKMEDMPNKPLVGPHLDHTWEDDYINIYGFGSWIAPKPNRIVLMAPNTYHSISRVDADAGDHSRCAIVGFFKKEAK